MKRKTFRSELLELWITTTKESRPDMFNFYADLVGHDMVIDTGKATKCRRKFKAPSLQTKSTKIEVPFENMGVNGKQFEDSHEKNSLLASTKKSRETHCPYMQEVTTNIVTRSTKIEEKLKKRTFRSK